MPMRCKLVVSPLGLGRKYFSTLLCHCFILLARLLFPYASPRPSNKSRDFDESSPSSSNENILPHGADPLLLSSDVASTLTTQSLREGRERQQGAFREPQALSRKKACKQGFVSESANSTNAREILGAQTTLLFQF